MALDWPRVATGAVVSAVGLAVLIPIASTYSVPLTEHVGHRVVWFTTVATRLPQGTRVLALPYGPVLSSKAMAYQAVDTLRFDLAGGYQIVPGTDRKSILAEPPPADRLLDSLSMGTRIWHLPEPPADAHNLSLLRSAVARWHIQLVAVTDFINAPYAVSFMTKAFDRPPIRERGAWVWIMGCSALVRTNRLCHSTLLKPIVRAASTSTRLTSR
jgi:hypothetical protein